VVGLKPIHILTGDMALDNLLNTLELVDLVSADQRISIP
jgi:hypothetical protein